MKITMPATIEDLPDPIIEYILSYLSPYRDLKQCMQVNRAWYRYVYDVVRKTQRDFYNAVCGMSVQWCHVVAEPGLTISKRYSHSACCNGNSMYIFGGCTTANTTFNDLWRLDLGTRCWIRPLATGTYPPPKACATLVSHGENLILFGGWTHTAPYPLHQVWRVFNQIHLYNTITNRWTHIISMPNCTPMAGHSATVHGDLMVVFGGIQRQVCDGPFLSSNEVWTLDLKTYKWQKQATSSVQPPPRYGHSQIAIDKHHLLIMGGCGGPNMLYTDIWLLKMSSDPEELWEWQEMDIHMKENAAPHLAFHPACKVGSQVVVMSKMQKSRTSPSSLPHLLRAPSRIWVPPRFDLDETEIFTHYQTVLQKCEMLLEITTDAPQTVPPSIEMKVAKQVPDVEPCVNGKRGVFKRHIDRQHSKTSHMSSSDEDDCHLQDVAKRKNNCSISNSLISQNEPSTSGVQSNACKTPVSSSPSPSSSSSSSSPSNASKSQNDMDTSTSDVSASKNDSKLSSQRNSLTRRNRQRQLEGLDRMEQRLKDLRAGNMGFPMSLKAFPKQNRSPVITTKNPMCLYVLDISKAVSDGYVTWRRIKKQSAAAPEEIILYSLVLGKGELIMFGGIQKDLNSRQQEGESVPEVVSNSLHFMTAERFVI